MITYIDVIARVRDIGPGSRRDGFTAAEGYVIEVIDDGAAFKVSHPDKGSSAYPRRIPITNVASWGDLADEPKRVKRVEPADEGVEDVDDVEVRRTNSSSVIHFGRPPERAEAPAPKKKAARRG